MMKISDFYSHSAMQEAWGKARIRRVISEIREVWPDALVKQTGQFPSFYRPVNQFYASWILFILSNCRSHNREDVHKAILRGMDLKDENGQFFVVSLGELLADPLGIKTSVKSVSIFYDADNMAIIEHENGTKFIYHGKAPAYKIRRSAVLEKDFLVEIAELIHEQVVKEDQENWDSQGDGFSEPD